MLYRLRNRILTLPIAPSNVILTTIGSTTADFEWTNNYGTNGSIIGQ